MLRFALLAYILVQTDTITIMLRLALLLAYILVHTVTAITKDDCPSNLDKYSRYLQVHDDKCYYFYLNRLEDYSDAEDVCFTERGNLAMVKTEDINKFLHTLLRYTYGDDKGNKRVWIGLSDLGKEGTFKWQDGSPMTYENFDTLEGTRSTFFHLTSFIEDCVAMDQDTGKWADYKCQSGNILFDERRPFICEFDAVARPAETSPAAPSTTDTPPELQTTQTNVTGDVVDATVP